MPDDIFQCEHCGGIFRRSWTTEEAARERLEVFGAPQEPDDCVVCGPCYQELMKRAREAGYVR